MNSFIFKLIEIKNLDYNIIHMHSNWHQCFRSLFYIKYAKNGNSVQLKILEIISSNIFLCRNFRYGFVNELTITNLFVI